MITDIFVILGTLFTVSLSFIYGAPISVKILIIVGLGLPCMCAASDLLGERQ